MVYKLDQGSSEKQNALAAGLRMKDSHRPWWLNETRAVNSALTAQLKGIDKDTHLKLSQNDRATILEWKTCQRKYAKGSAVEVPLLDAEWGVIELRVQPPRGKNNESDRDPVLLVRPRAIADEPLLLQDLIYQDRYWALDIRLTYWLRRYVDRQYSGPGSLIIDEGRSFLEAAAITIVGLSTVDDWKIAGEKLGAIFNDSFNAGITTLIRNVRRAHQSARR